MMVPKSRNIGDPLDLSMSSSSLDGSSGRRRLCFVAPRRENSRGLIRSNSAPEVYLLESCMVVSTSEESNRLEYGNPERKKKDACELGRSQSSRSLVSINGNLPPAGRDRGHIRWNLIEIREYERALGDNPSCSCGAPMTLGWNYDPNVERLSIDEYEATRPERRNNFEMLVPRDLRFEMLTKEWNVSRGQVAQQVRINTKIKNQRRQSVSNAGRVTQFEEFIEKVRKTVSRRLRGRKKSSVQYALWQEEAERAKMMIAEITATEAEVLAAELERSRLDLDEHSQEVVQENPAKDIFPSGMTVSPAPEGPLQERKKPLVCATEPNGQRKYDEADKAGSQGLTQVCVEL